METLYALDFNVLEVSVRLEISGKSLGKILAEDGSVVEVYNAELASVGNGNYIIFFVVLLLIAMDYKRDK